MDLETVILSEVSQTENDKYNMISCICGIYIDNTNELTKQKHMRRERGAARAQGLGLIDTRSVQSRHSVVSDSFQPHELQHARPPCPSQLPEFTQTHVHRVRDAIQPSHPGSSPSPPAPNPSQHQSLFQ